MDVNGDLLLNSSTSNSLVSGTGVLNLAGDLTATSFGGGGGSLPDGIVLDGAGTQVISGTANGFLPSFRVNSTGTADFNGDLYFNRHFTHDAGTVDTTGSTFHFVNSPTINQNGRINASAVSFNNIVINLNNN